MRAVVWALPWASVFLTLMLAQHDLCRTGQRTNGTTATISQLDNPNITLIDDPPCTAMCIREEKTSLCAPASGDPAFNFPVNDRIRCYCAQVRSVPAPRRSVAHTQHNTSTPTSRTAMEAFERIQSPFTFTYRIEFYGKSWLATHKT